VLHKVEWLLKTFNPAQKDQALANIRAWRGFNLPTFKMSPQRGGSVILVGGGPSVSGQLDKLRELAGDPENIVLCVNDAHNWLIERGIVPDFCVLQEVAPWEYQCYKAPHPDVTYLVATICDPGIYDRLKDYRLVNWHADAGIGDDALVGELWPGDCLVSGGHTTALRCLNLGLCMGRRDFQLFGMDSSHEAESHVYYDLPEDVQPRMKVFCAGRWFTSAPYLIRQAEFFGDFCKRHGFMFTLRTHGDGLLPHVHRTLYPHVYQEA
jgi:hypothetical protein